MSAPVIPLRANNTLVASAWLKLAVPGVGVATRLPAADAAMRTAGFIRVVPVGGSPDLYSPLRSPVVTAECWAAPATEGSSKVPTARANALAEAVIAATYDEALMDVVLDLGAGYPDVRVRTVQALSEPLESPDDPSNYGRFDVDLLLLWSTQ